MSAGTGPALGPRLWIVGAVLVGYGLFFHTTFLVPDSSGTYAWGRSLLFGGDVDFTDELARLGSIAGDDQVRFHAVTEQGLPGNPFGMGAGVLWMPFLLVAQVSLWVAGGAPSPAGYADLHILAASTGTAVYGLAALLLSYRVARRHAVAPVALAAVLACGLGTPFLAYLYHLPTYAHVPAAFGAALALAAALAARGSSSAWRWALAGAAVGLAATIRAQHVALLAVPVALWFPSRDDAHRGRSAKDATALAVGFLLAFGPQLLAWWWIYGGLGVPQGGQFLDLLRPHAVAVLFSAWHGLFPWAPILLVAVAGLGLLFRGDRRLAAGLIAAVVAEGWLAASAADWWGGYAVGARRFVDLTPLFVIGLAVSFQALRDRSRKELPAVLAAVAIVWNLGLTLQVRTGMLSPFRVVSYGELLGGQLRAVARLPAYLWSEATSSWAPIHLVVHRDSPVQPRFDAAPGWLVPLTLGACWALGLAAILVLERRCRGEGPLLPSS